MNQEYARSTCNDFTPIPAPVKGEGVRRWSAVFPELPACASAGDTGEDAVRNTEEALALWFAPSDLPLDKNAKVLEVTLP